MIQTITKYKFKGKEYNYLKEIQDAIHNTIGEEVIDKINKTCDLNHKDLFKLLDILCSKDVREALTECYNVTYKQIDDDGEDYKTINILDTKF